VTNPSSVLDPISAATQSECPSATYPPTATRSAAFDSPSAQPSLDSSGLLNPVRIIRIELTGGLAGWLAPLSASLIAIL